MTGTREQGVYGAERYCIEHGMRKTIDMILLLERGQNYSEDYLTGMKGFCCRWCGCKDCYDCVIAINKGTNHKWRMTNR